MTPSSSTLILKAPAKVNHFLYVNGRFDDGYHRLQTLMQFVDLCDTITIEKRSDKAVCVFMDGVPQRTNLVIDAAELLKRKVPVPFGVNISIDKAIPIGAGMGGGSSDAATCLIALNELWQAKIDREQLATMSLEIGADVPLFVLGENALAEGKGEQLTPVSLESSTFVIVNPGIHVNTGEIFADSQLTRSTPIKTIRQLLASPMANDLEAVTRRLYPQVGEVVEWLSQFGDARMSGSGASVFLQTESVKVAKGILDKTPTAWKAFLAHGMTQHPLRDWTL